MNKRGQFYLIAAIIIVAVVIGIATYSNYAVVKNEGESIKLYELSKELNLEGESVINYGIANNQPDLDALLKMFTETYGQYVSESDSDVYFIYGDEESVTVYGYIKQDTGSISLDVGGTPYTVQIQPTGIIESPPFEIINSDANVLIEVGDNQYPFEINEGQNFFFILKQQSQNVQ